MQDQARTAAPEGTTMSDFNPPKPECRFRLRTPLVFALLVLSGCGPSKEQQAIDACNQGIAQDKRGEYDIDAASTYAREDWAGLPRLWSP